MSLSPDLHEILGGVRIRPPACCAHVDPSWAAMLADVIRSCAPWQLHRAVPRKPQKLAIFPGQTHVRKACVALACGPQLVIETTASNVRLPELVWKRPLAIDLHRLGLT